MTAHEPETAEELERLRMERDQLQSQVSALTERRRSRVRGVLAPVLVVLACVCLVAATVGVWAKRNFLDTDRFVSRVGPLIEEPAVQDAIAGRLTEQIVGLVDLQAVLEEALPPGRERLVAALAAPLSGAVEGFVGDHVDAFVATDAFRRLWVGAAEVAHTAAVRVLRGEATNLQARDGTITLNLVPVVDQVLARITAASPEILGRQVNIPDVSLEDVPEAAVTKLESALGRDLPEDFGQVTVYDDGALAAAQDGLELFDKLVVAFVVGMVLFTALALWVSQRRRRTLLQLTVGATLGLVLLRRVIFRLEAEVAELPPRPAGKEAAGLAAGNFLDPLVTFTQLALVGLVIVALVAVLTADYPWVVSLRRRVATVAASAFGAVGRGATDDATVRWIAGHQELLQAAVGALVLVALWALDLSWFGVLVVLAVGAALALAVRRVHVPDAPGPEERLVPAP
jgi:hypothetical protein